MSTKRGIELIVEGLNVLQTADLSVMHVQAAIMAKQTGLPAEALLQVLNGEQSNVSPEILTRLYQEYPSLKRTPPEDSENLRRVDLS